MQQPPPRGPHGPAGPPYAAGPGRPWTPPPRRRRVRPLHVLLIIGVLAVLGVLVIGAVFYVQDYRPRHYLEQWAGRTGAPKGRFTREDRGGDNHARYLRFSEQCAGSTPCDPTPVKAVTDWVSDQGGDVTEDRVTECFRDGNAFEFHYGKHPVDIDCEPVDSASQPTFTFTARLGY